MEKTVIRTQIVSCISSKIIQAYNGDIDLKTLCEKFGINWVLEKIFLENTFSFQELLKEYEKFAEGEENTLFADMYILSPNFGIVIDEHICLYHCNPDIFYAQKNTLPWIYMESKKYIGDTWWFKDEEILQDIQKLSIIEFLEKYRGW